MSSSRDNLYHLSGIADVADFYKTKFLSDEVLDQRYFKALDRFDIRFARTMWVYDNVRAGATVLDLGCGAGMLALLKRKGVTLVGVDLSTDCALAARRNGYDQTFTADLTRLPFVDNSFDYVVSLDVLGHVDFSEKDQVLREISRVLRDHGVTLNGIECTDHATRPRLSSMTPEELRQFVDIDGHVGLEEEQEHAERFKKFFTHVAWEPRYTLCLSSEEFIKQHDRYRLPFESDFIDYLRELTFSERRAFDLAMGYVFNKISDLDIKLPKAGLYVLLKASATPLGPFYNEHRDRELLLRHHSDGGSCLDRRSDAVFDDGWFEPNNLPPVARWMGKRARIDFNQDHVTSLSFDVTTHLPQLETEPLEVEITLNGQHLSSWSIIRQGWVNITLPIPAPINDAANGNFALELRANRTWQPRPNPQTNDEPRDDREISLAVCNIEVFGT